MARFSIQLPDNLNTWLDYQAAAEQRSKNAQIITVLEQAMSKSARQIMAYAGYNLPCQANRHYFKCDKPKENEACNCGKVRW